MKGEWSKQDVTCKWIREQLCSSFLAYCVGKRQLEKRLNTVFTRILAAATINFSCARVRLLIEGGSYSRAALIKNNAHARLTYARANAIYNKPDQNFMLTRV